MWYIFYQDVDSVDDCSGVGIEMELIEMVRVIMARVVRRPRTAPLNQPQPTEVASKPLCFDNMSHGYDEDYDDNDGSGHDASYDSPRPRFDERAKDAKYTGWRSADQPCQGGQRQRQYNIQRQIYIYSATHFL